MAKCHLSSRHLWSTKQQWKQSAITHQPYGVAAIVIQCWLSCEGSLQFHSSHVGTAFIDKQEMSENVVIVWRINQQAVKTVISLTVFCGQVSSIKSSSMIHKTTVKTVSNYSPAMLVTAVWSGSNWVGFMRHAVMTCWLRSEGSQSAVPQFLRSYSNHSVVPIALSCTICELFYV